MNISANAQNILDSFSELLGIEELEWDEDGLIELRVDESNGMGESTYVSIACQDSSDVLILCSQMLPASKHLPDRLLRRILATNTKLLNEGGASFAIVPGNGALVLQKFLNLENLDHPGFEAAWVGYLEVHDKLRNKLKELAPESADEHTVESEGSSSDGRFSLDDLRTGMLRV